MKMWSKFSLKMRRPVATAFCILALSAVTIMQQNCSSAETSTQYSSGNGGSYGGGNDIKLNISCTTNDGTIRVRVFEADFPDGVRMYVESPVDLSLHTHAIPPGPYEIVEIVKVAYELKVSKTGFVMLIGATRATSQIDFASGPLTGSYPATCE